MSPNKSDALTAAPQRVQPVIRAVGGLGMREGGLLAMLWVCSESTAIGKEASMSMAKGVASGKVESLVEMANEMSEFVERSAAQGGALREVERGVFDRLLSMGRVLVDQFIALQGNGDLGETATMDDSRTLHRSATTVVRKLRTIFGEHEFAAYVYRKRSHPNTPIALRPVDARMRLSSGRWSDLLEEFTQLFCLDESYATAAAAFERIFRQRLSVDSLERVNGRMGDEAAEFLDALAPPPPAEEGDLLVVTADGKGVPMVRDDAAKLRCFEERPQRPGNRRMATLASVYSVDRHVRTPERIIGALFRDPRAESPPDDVRPEPCHKRVIARFPQLFEEIDERQPISGMIVALSWAAREVRERRRDSQPLVRLMDGQPSLWDAADACLADVPAEETIDVLDIVHVAGYVWRAAKTFHAHKEHQEAFVRERLLRILRGDVKAVIAGMRRMATLRALPATERREIDTVCGYFETHAERMRYDEYLANGCPIATGVIEGACRHLVKDRMERSGMRWTQPHAQAMLDVRAAHQSSYWDAFHERRLQARTKSLEPYRNLLDRLTPLAG